MKLNDPRLKLLPDGRYCYYIADQRYLLVRKTCPACKTEYLTRPYKNWQGREQIYCSKSCRAKSIPSKQQREKHWNWKGGRVKDNHGYIQILHNRLHPANYRGYVLEHVLVMERILGRYLTKDENVHHKNGIRDDNRPENLELWSTSQPYGQRVIDKVRWAKEILQLYKEVESGPQGSQDRVRDADLAQRA